MNMTEPERRERADIVVIGGGPAGSAAALRLARRGVHVIQIERRVFNAPENDRLRSGEGALPATVREIERLGIATRGQPWTIGRATRVRIRWPSGALSEDPFPGERSISVLDRESFDAALWQSARDEGAEGRCGWNVERIWYEDDVVAGVVARSLEGERIAVQAPLVLDAGGRNAPSLVQANLREAELPDDFMVVVLFFDHVPELEPDRWEMHFFDPSHPSVIQGAYLTPGICRWGLGTSLRLKRGSRLSPEAFFWERLRGYPELEARLRAGQVVRPAYARARLAYRSRQVVRAGLLLVGDAAGYFNPVLGDGILMALRSAELASDVAVDALRSGDVSARRLAPYAHRWARARHLRLALGRALVAAHGQPAMLNRLGQAALLRRMMLRALLHAPSPG